VVVATSSEGFSSSILVCTAQLGCLGDKMSPWRPWVKSLWEYEQRIPVAAETVLCTSALDILHGLHVTSVCSTFERLRLDNNTLHNTFIVLNHTEATDCMCIVHSQFYRAGSKNTRRSSAMAQGSSTKRCHYCTYAHRLSQKIWRCSPRVRSMNSVVQ